MWLRSRRPAVLRSYMTGGPASLRADASTPYIRVLWSQLHLDGGLRTDQQAFSGC
jgi:hypothetical protein